MHILLKRLIQFIVMQHADKLWDSFSETFMFLAGLITTLFFLYTFDCKFRSINQ